MPPEHQPHLFAPFYTSKPQGTWLGLAISAHIITQHGGKISVESTVAVGTTFTVVESLSRVVIAFHRRRTLLRTMHIRCSGAAFE